MNNDLGPIHPGEFLLEDFLEPLHITPKQLAKRIQVPAPHILEIVEGTCGITGEIALRLARLFGTTPQLWMNLQSRYELERAQTLLGKRLEEEVNPLQKVA